MVHFGEIRTNYIEEFEGKDYQYIDTWRTADDNEEGHSVAKVDLETGEVIWFDTNKNIISNPQIIVAIADIIKRNNLC